MRRALLVVAVVAFAMPVGVVGAARWYLNGDAVRARIADAVRRATGRELTIAGPVRLAWSLSPTIALDDVSLSNPPGFSRPSLAHIGTIEAQIGLIPLLSHRVEIERLLLAGPDVLLERDAQGRPNWVLAPPAAAGAPSPAPAASGGARYEISLGRVDVREARIGWGGASPATLTASTLQYDPQAGRVDGKFVVRGAEMALSGTAGPAAAAWPLALHLVGSGLDVTLSGTTGSAALVATAADLSTLSPLAGRSLPPLHDVRLAATLAGAAPVGPANLAATAVIGALPIGLSARADSLPALLAGGPAPVTLRAAAADAELLATGTASLDGHGELSLTGHADDLAALGTAARIALPALQNVLLATKLGVAPGSIALSGFRLQSVQGDLDGDLSLTMGPRPLLRGALASTRIDLAALAPRASSVPSPASPPPSPPPVQQRPAPARQIPDAPVPFALLRQADADLSFHAAEALYRGRTLHDLALHALLHDGTLRLDPASVTIGDKLLTAQLVADAGGQTVALKLDGSALQAGIALALLGGPPDSGGRLDIHADLRGTGATVRDLMASLAGQAGVAMVDAEIDNSWLQGLLRAANLPLEAGGRSRLRCAAWLGVATGGQVQVRALALDSAKLKLDGGGEVDLADETMNLRLAPQLRIGGGLSVPVRVRGTLSAPKVALDPGAIAPGRVGIILGGPAPTDTCGPALALARGEQAAASAPAPVPDPEPPTKLKPVDLLRSLLR